MFTGTGTALVTPFRRDGSLDEPVLRALIKRQIEAGIDFLVPCGTTGESPTLTHEEHLRVVQITVELAKGKVSVLAGAGGYNTSEVIALARESDHFGSVVASGAGEDGDFPLSELDGDLDDTQVLFVRERGALAGCSTGNEEVDARFDLTLD